MKCLGVDIGSSSIKIAEIEGSGRIATVTQLIELPLSTDPMRDQALEVIEKLRGFSTAYAGTDIRWVIAVGQSSVSTRLKRFPFSDRQKVLKSLPFELEEDIPFDAGSTVFDARIVETFPNGSDVIAIACPFQPVEEALARAKDGGFEAELISVEGLALSNILDTWWASPVENSTSAHLGDELFRARDVRPGHAILQIGHKRTNLIVYRDGHLVAVRSIEWGGHDVAVSLETIFKIPYIEAVKVLQSKSFVLLNSSGASRDQLAMHKAVSDAAIPLIRELRMTLLDVRASAGTELRDLRLTGGASQIQNLAPWLTQALEVAVSPLEYFDTMTATGKIQFRGPRTPEIENVSATAIGLAIEGLRKTKNPPINLRKGLFTKSNETVKIFWETWKSTIQIAISIFLVFSVYAFSRESISLRLAEQSDEMLSGAAKSVAGLKGAQATTDGVSSYIRTENREIKHRETLAQLSSYMNAFEFVVKLAERLPVQLPPRSGRGLDIDRLTIDNDDLIVEGRAQGSDVLANVERELQSIARAGTVKKSTPSALRINAPGTAFGFSMKIDRKP